eukprot:GEZU01020253.1.p1 GENE.GEZU01020253.1~~GEZU01020253.1.p1  ORF type:complete len:111 (-),score=10.75 GEZU01020253.1:63-395(-)
MTALQASKGRIPAEASNSGLDRAVQLETLLTVSAGTIMAAQLVISFATAILQTFGSANKKDFSRLRKLDNIQQKMTEVCGFGPNEVITSASSLFTNAATSWHTHRVRQLQ